MSRIRAQGLAKTFRIGFFMRPLVAVRNVDLEVREGEIFGFLGPNGAGKTTTIKMLAGLVFPSSGRAFIGDLPAEDPRSRERLGFLPEGTYFHEYLTGREFLNFHAHLLGVPGEVRRERIPRLLDRVGIAGAADLQLRRYSKGMRQRAGLAQALVGDPDVLILDEPMSGLDPIGRKEVRDLIHSLKDEGKTVFFSSHILADAEMICDRVAIIIRGSIVHEGRVDDLLGQEIHGVELVVEGIDEELHGRLTAQAHRAVAQGSRFLFEFESEDDAEKALDDVRSSGGHIRSLTPRRRSLEDLMVEEARREGAA
ncbi:MAG: ABC transporter ATP-binding protein [Myxococcota bacterium]